VPALAIIVAGAGSLIVMITIPALIFVTTMRSREPLMLPTVVALLLWVGVSVALACVWFIVAVAAHGMDDPLTYSWIVANASYPIIGIAIVLIHRRLLR
jgi:predicted permease